MKSVVGIIIFVLPEAKRHVHFSKSWVEFKLGLKTFSSYTQSMLKETCVN